MKSIQTATISRGSLLPHDSLQVYNGLDCMLTVEIKDEVAGPNNVNLKPYSRLIYDFERGMQAPALEMMLRGWRVDLFARDVEVARLRREVVTVQKILDEFVLELWDGGKSPLDPKGKTPGLNPQSPKQMKEFFYGRLKLPEQYKYDKGEKKVTLNRDALEALEDYFFPRPFINCILAVRLAKKRISVLTSEVDADYRMRTSYNVTGTETGRWSSSANVFDGGTNLQNITEELRYIFVADPGKKLAYIDLSQAEARVVGFIIWVLFQDPTYLDACESGDLHTAVAKLVWPELPWTGDLEQDKEIAERKFYLWFSYRDLSKKGGHGTNYYGKPRTVAKHLKVQPKIIEEFQQRYFARFPGISRWHQWVAKEIQTHQYLEDILGGGRHFFGRPGDDATLREAIAHGPQSVVGRLLNLCLWRVWRNVPRVDILGQVHDAIVIQYDEKNEEEAIRAVLPHMNVEFSAHGRKFVIPSDVMVGWNWGKQKKNKETGVISNPDGLIKWTGNDTRKRQVDPDGSGLDRIIS